MKILFLTTHYPPNNTGAATVMHNLISSLDKEIVAGVITHANKYNDLDEKVDNVDIHYILNFVNLLPLRIRYYARKLFVYNSIKKIQRIIDEKKPSHIICVYPDLDFIDLGIKISKKNTSIKFIPYLHDTIAEGLNYKKYYKRAQSIQEHIIKNYDTILVMSEGMKDLFSTKYNCKTIPIPHSFPERIKGEINLNESRQGSMFWGGSIYSINQFSALRFERALSTLSIKFKLSNANEESKLIKLGFRKDNFQILPFLSRVDYLNLLMQQDALLMAIDSFEESPVHKDELSTIFPTKTIEYLMSGKPVIVNCPTEYFLSRFFKENDCGLVINSIDSKIVKQEIDKYLNNIELQKKHIVNAFKTLEMFKVSNVKKLFIESIK